ncbi:STAS/SEC14 domain-containing protein [Actibacterium sp.]|uniref:STAS/SEC14 domain-containing protein n=1 Tax=Actibacterium sp. TaxID=1872125 RepID=UPI003564D187
MTAKSPHIQVLPDYPVDVLALSASGCVTHDDYEQVIMPLVDQKIASQGKLKLLYLLGPEFESYSAGAAWDDARLGVMHLADFARIAIVTDKKWIRRGVKMFAPLIRCPVQLFDTKDLAAAKAWITANV